MLVFASHVKGLSTTIDSMYAACRKIRALPVLQFGYGEFGTFSERMCILAGTKRILLFLFLVKKIIVLCFLI